MTPEDAAMICLAGYLPDTTERQLRESVAMQRSAHAAVDEAATRESKKLQLQASLIPSGPAEGGSGAHVSPDPSSSNKDDAC